MSDPAAGIEASGVDPATVQTLSELAEAFQRLRGTRSYAELDKAVNPNHGRRGPRALPPSTLNNLLNAKSVPTRETVTTFLMACGLDEDAQVQSLAAWDRVATAHLRRPAGAMRVREARARLLGVHASIQVNPAATDLPVYVPRDLDADLRTAITVAAGDGGFVLLIGDSSVGKSRALFEAVRATLPDWWLVHPANAEDVRVMAEAPTARTVVWLDELQDFLNGPDPLAAATVRVLIAAGLILVATLWPDEYSARIALRAAGKPDPHADERQLLGLAHPLQVLDRFSAAERCRAEALASDRRIRVALDSQDPGFTQILAAGPELIRRWENAAPYSKAVITAALDARRIGAAAPLTRALLEAAAPGYLTPAQVAAAPQDWADKAVAFATTRLHGSAAPLTPVPGGMGCVAGYDVADYLHQYARRARRTVPLSDTAWQALVAHHHPDDTARLADSAERRGRDAYAETLYQKAADAGDSRAAAQLAELLIEQGRVDEAIILWRARADTGDSFAAFRLDGLLVERSRVDDLRARSDIGDGYAADQLANLLIKLGRVDEATDVVQAQADGGNRLAAAWLANLLVEQGRVDDLRARADARDGVAACRLANLLIEYGRVDEALVVLQNHATSDELAALQLAELLAEQGRAEMAIDLLQAGVHARSEPATVLLANLLVERGNVERAIVVLKTRVQTKSAMVRLVNLLAELGRADEAIVLLQDRADAGDGFAAHLLVERLAEQGRMDEAIVVLQDRADTGDGAAAFRLAELLVEQGKMNELQARARAGDELALDLLTDLLAKQDRVDEAIDLLQLCVDAGQRSAAVMLAGMLAEQNRIHEAIGVLRPRAAADESAADALIALLAEHGLIAEIEAETHAGTSYAAKVLRAHRRAATQGA
jgi:hypothetical protein